MKKKIAYVQMILSNSEYTDPQQLRSSIKKRARSSAVEFKREQSRIPVVNPQYGEQILTPRQQGYQAKRKPVLVDMDTDDETIWTMKNQGYKDDPVALHLIQQGRHHYDPKTIATRYSRMRRIQAAQEEKNLDEDFSDFHEEEVSTPTATYDLQIPLPWSTRLTRLGCRSACLRRVCQRPIRERSPSHQCPPLGAHCCGHERG